MSASHSLLSEKLEINGDDGDLIILKAQEYYWDSYREGLLKKCFQLFFIL